MKSLSLTVLLSVTSLLYGQQTWLKPNVGDPYVIGIEVIDSVFTGAGECCIGRPYKHYSKVNFTLYSFVISEVITHLDTTVFAKEALSAVRFGVAEEGLFMAGKGYQVSAGNTGQRELLVIDTLDQHIWCSGSSNADILRYAVCGVGGYFVGLVRCRRYTGIQKLIFRLFPKREVKVRADTPLMDCTGSSYYQALQAYLSSEK